jgi:ketosteroid isomerase-like protein
MMLRWLGPLAVLGAACLSSPAPHPPNADLRQQVMKTERAFAKTMADRDHGAFSTFLSKEAIFFDKEGAIRGSEAVAEAWRPLFEGTEAPFSWEPTVVEVLDSGSLALSSGPIRDPNGKIVGTFNSIWRREPDGTWRVVFDKGCSAPQPSS